MSATEEVLDKKKERRRILKSPKYNRVGFKDEKVTSDGNTPVCLRESLVASNTINQAGTGVRVQKANTWCLFLVLDCQMVQSDDVVACRTPNVVMECLASVIRVAASHCT